MVGGGFVSHFRNAIIEIDSSSSIAKYSEKMKIREILWSILLPLGLFACYQLLLASRLYEAESRFVVKQMGENTSPLDFGIGLLGGAPSTSMEDAGLVQEYIQSPNLLDKLQEQLDLRGHFVGFGADFLNYFQKNASKEDFLARYRKMVKIKIDPETNVMVLTVLAYDPETAESMADAISREGERFVNKISEGMAREQVDFVKKEVDRSELRLREVRQKLIQFQDAQSLLDPEHQSETVIGLIAGLETKLVEAKAERFRLLSFLKKNTPEVVTNQQQISSLEQQVLEEKSRLTGADHETLNRKLTEFKELQLEVEFALEAYKAGFASLEKARLDASRKLKHFVMLSSTGLPEEAAYPRVLYNLITALVVILLLYGIIRLVWATIQDHRI
jgi:capsular polysaccharide transport system permease protein